MSSLKVRLGYDIEHESVVRRNSEINILIIVTSA
jgi:hypothetical protein